MKEHSQWSFTDLCKKITVWGWAMETVTEEKKYYEINL